jgi:hypothetical protein
MKRRKPQGPRWYVAVKRYSEGSGFFGHPPQWCVFVYLLRENSGLAVGQDVGLHVDGEAGRLCDCTPPIGWPKPSAGEAIAFATTVDEAMRLGRESMGWPPLPLDSAGRSG